MILAISLENANIDWKRKKSYVGYIVQPSFPGSWRCQRRLVSSQQASALAWEPSQRKQGQLPLRWSPSTTLRSPYYWVLENINITSRWRVVSPVAESMNSLSFPSNGWASFNCRPPTWQREVRQNLWPSVLDLLQSIEKTVIFSLSAMIAKLCDTLDAWHKPQRP